MEQIIKIMHENGIKPSQQDLLIMTACYNYGRADASIAAVADDIENKERLIEKLNRKNINH